MMYEANYLERRRVNNAGGLLLKMSNFCQKFNNEKTFQSPLK